MAASAEPAFPAGYSEARLPKKLGIKEGSRVAFVNPPHDFDATLGELPFAAEVGEWPDQPVDVLILFAAERAQFEAEFAPAAKRLATNGGLWVAWPKRASKVPTNLDENQIRDFGLAAGLVDNKVCAIDATWSGLRFVYRLKDRPR